MLGNAENKRIEKGIERLGATNESLRGILEAFEPLLLAQGRMRTELLTAGLTAIPPDPAEFTRGIPIMVDKPLGDWADAFLTAARKIFPVMAQAFPGISDALGLILHNLETGMLDPTPLMEACITGDETTIRALAKKSKLNIKVLALAGAYAMRPIIQVCGREAQEAMADHNWERGYCPVCGGLPHVALLKQSGVDDPYLKGHGAQRWLSCSRCITQWRFKRHACPHCGNEENDTLEYYQSQSNTTERADLCKACGHYLVTLDVREYLEEPQPDVAALGLIPLDILMQRKGYTPVADTAWNKLG
ncbi:formate dehydrogenase accessory protein FdhE [Desulfovibrio ferrophilus]|uniref:Formate dehydrogenase accessory protein n=1 Tax=Desulfovibrio ferrophilus TaxID=241368 RepID=A0A2Z6AXZ6_9BACT|nr:formate dehydrogenase accessory protein FdhE [Desulfovibrio ferrophilus]BBD08080.1 formate dehydrogenase accessory protein [Desulfovibrio ferrophilus]